MISKKFGLLVIVMITIVLAFLVLVQKNAFFNNSSLMKPTNVESQNQEKSKVDNPCWFKTEEGLKAAGYEKIKKRQDRQMFGYESDIPLSEAVKIFNEELQCSTVFQTYPQLTEEEVIGAIVGGADYGGENDARIAQKDILWKIAAERTMPKSSLLNFNSGGRIPDSPLRPDVTIQAKGIRITLTLGIDPVHGLKDVKPEQIFIIRKVFSGFEEVK